MGRATRVGALAVTAIAVMAIGLTTAAIGDRTVPRTRTLAPKQQRNLDARIRAVETGIMPAVVVRGDDAARYTIRAMMERCAVQGVSVTVINEGRIEWRKSWGVRLVDGDELSDDHLQQAASVSKPVVAMAVLRLVQDGILDLDADVNTYLRSWQVPENEFTGQRKVTLRHLLSHTAGISTFNANDGAVAGEVPTLLQLLNGEPPAKTPPTTVDQVPGSGYRYSNRGYAVVQQLLIDVVGKPFPGIMHDLVLEPLGMTQSTFEQPLPDDLQTNAASGHIGAGEPVTGGSRIYPDLGAGGLWTTPADLARFVIEIHDALVGDRGRVLSRDMARTMLTEVSDGVGLGLGIHEEEDGDLKITHGGHNTGFFCQIAGRMRSGQGVVILANSNRAIPLLTGLTFAVAEVYDWPGPAPMELEPYSLSTDELEAYTGRYAINEDYIVTISLEAGRLKISHFEGEDYLVPASASDFYQELDGVKLTFERDEEGLISTISLMDGMLVMSRIR